MLRILANARLLLHVKGWRAALRYVAHFGPRSLRLRNIPAGPYYVDRR